MDRSRLFTILGLITIAVMSRLIPHAPNFTAVNAIAVFSVFTLRSFSLSCLMVCISMFFCDLLLGLHSQLFFVYLSICLITFMSHYRLSVFSSLLTSSFIFFLVVDFGVWLMDGFYPLTFKGLITCYTAALPFLAQQILSTFVWGLTLFGCSSLVEKYKALYAKNEIS